MTIRNTTITMIALAISAAIPAGAWAQDDEASPVRVYLPRTKVVNSPTLKLADIAYISGQNAAMADKARGVTLGRSPFPGEKLTLARSVILARLAGVGIDRENVQLTGAGSVRIRRDSSTVASEDFVEAAEAFIRTRISRNNISWHLTRKPAKLNIAGQKKISLRCSETGSPNNGQFRVSVAVIDQANDKELGRRDIVFKLKYQSQQAVATRDISPGEIVSPDNAKLEVIMTGRKTAKATLPFGSKAIRHISRGCVITAGHVARPKPRVLVQRNKTVRIKITGPGWQITTLGVALQKGRAGDAIRVRNVDSNKIIVAKVDTSGDVIPVMARR